MSRFSKRASSSLGFSAERVADGTGNLAGQETPQQRLWRLVTTLFLGKSDSLYYSEHKDDRPIHPTEAIIETVEQMPPTDALSLAEKAARVGIRHGALLALVGLVRKGAKDIVRHADPSVFLGTPREAQDLLALWRLYGSKEGRYPHCLTDLIARAFSLWDEYSLRKHWGSGAYTVRSLMRLVRPKPDQATQDLWSRAARGKEYLKTPDTWEVLISEAGSDQEKRKAAWEKLIGHKKLPALACIRNLNNMLKDGVSLTKLADYIRSLRPKYLDVYNVIKAMAAVPQLTESLLCLVENFYQNSWELPSAEIVIDVSGSMGYLDRNLGNFGGSFLNRAVAVAYAVALASSRSTVWFSSGSDATRTLAIRKMQGNPKNLYHLIEETKLAASGLGGGGIFTAQTIEYLNRHSEPHDLTLVISDSQDTDYPDRANKRPRRSGGLCVEINIAPYQRVHVTERAFPGGGAFGDASGWIVIDGWTTGIVPFLKSRL